MGADTGSDTGLYPAKQQPAVASILYQLNVMFAHVSVSLRLTSGCGPSALTSLIFSTRTTGMYQQPYSNGPLKEKIHISPYCC